MIKLSPFVLSHKVVAYELVSVVVTRLPLGLEKPLIKPTIVYLALEKRAFSSYCLLLLCFKLCLKSLVISRFASLQDFLK
jgi:hypothetical protein